MNETDADKPEPKPENDGTADEPAQPQSTTEPSPDPAQVTADPGKSWKDKSTWLRGVFMVFFAIAFEVGKVLLMCTALVQFLWLLFARTPNELLQKFGRSLSDWLSHVAAYLTCASNDKPFPWSPWPNGDPE